MGVPGALVAAARSMVHPIIAAVMVVPMLAASVFWVVATWLTWDAWSPLVHVWIMEWTPASWEAAWLGTAAAFVVAAVTVVPLILMTSALIATLFAMPVLLRHVAGRSFPGLDRRRGGTVWGSAWNAFAALAVFAVLWILTLPLWLIGPLAFVVPLLLAAHLNQRLFRYDALSEHASTAEMEQVISSARGRLFLLGLFTGLIYFVPLVNLVAPVYAAVAFIHLCLAELAGLRAAQAGGTRQKAGNDKRDISPP